MSKINAVRIINLNYNNDAIKISDEIFEMNGESTLLSLQNGGGKSVLVQMILSLFVHKRYHKMMDRSFTGYFTTNKPTFIMVEWKLDGGAGYVLTGMMVRKSQEIAEDNANELEMINFISEYKERCQQDLYHLPVVEKTKKQMVLKNFGACRQLFETYKKERSVPFFCYDMNNSAQTKQYFTRLMEYQISYKEWETIIRKINLKESGLSELFNDCKDEKGLVDKWFLEAVENKLNKENNRVLEFQNIVEKYIIQYKDNQSKILRRDAIQCFQEESVQIHSEAENYRHLMLKKKLQESRIADFIGKLHQFLQEEKIQKKELEDSIQEIVEEITHLNYEKLSAEIYKIQKEIIFSQSNYDMIQMEKDDLENTARKILEKIHLMDCAEQQLQVNEDREEFETDSQKLAICREKNHDLEPERKDIGGQLKSYYRGCMEQGKEKAEVCQQKLEKLESDSAEENRKREELAQKEKTLVEELGALKSKISAYDATEEQFNRKYHAGLRRNILGAYEPGLFMLLKKEYEKQLEQSNRAKTTVKKEIDDQKEQLKTLQRNIQDGEIRKTQKAFELRSKKEKQEQFQSELEERKVLLHYFDLEEESLFDSEKILGQAAKIIQETEVSKNTYMIEENILQKQYKKLTQGQVLELSEEFKKMLEDAGISYVYGMEWLLKNQKTSLENKMLVEQHPFLPYALILTRQELRKLRELSDQVYTSFPVPILVREELEQQGDKSVTAVYEFPQVSFYMWFNDNLLDEQKLAVMVRAKEQEIKKIQSIILVKQQECNGYIEKQGIIQNQKVTKDLYEEGEKQIRALQEEIEISEEQIGSMRQEQTVLENVLKNQERTLSELENQIRNETRCLEDYEYLETACQQYEENRGLLEKRLKEQERLEGQQRLCEDTLDALKNQISTKESEKRTLEQLLDEDQKKLMIYVQYEECPVKCPEQISAMEIRYNAITGQLGAEQTDLEQRLERSAARAQKSQNKLEELQKKYGFEQNQWSEVLFDRRERAHQESDLEDKNRKIKQKERQLNEEQNKITRFQTEEKGKRETLFQQCNTRETLPKNEIRVINYDAEMKEKEYAKKEYVNRIQAEQEKINGYDGLLTALAEYREFTVEESVTWEIELSTISIEDLVKQKGFLIRDYNQYGTDISEKHRELDRLLDRLARMQQFQDSFYQKPIEALQSLTGDAVLLIRQLDTILQSFQSLMEKLMVDISFVEKEKEKVVELLEDYLKEVHTELGKIDHNSTITVREKAIKMLKITLPAWEENESLYHLRLQDSIDDVTEKGVKILEENGNLLEFIGTRITTKAVYDTVIGIANVQIRLYKIEAQREYPITWSDVAKNSGGEGFLSAFVILASLLHYMRKDDSDIFADRNEGKVLIMDNPFAQTNASHLLKPLMDMARKTNTQLICLTGLSGESIYNRFDNIYVLTLIAANLRNGMQYLKADHIRGSEEETMIVSQIEVFEQQELMF